MAPTFLPLELVEIILASCDKPTLLICSLVCRAWVPFTRHRLFSFLELSWQDRCGMRLEDMLRSPQNTISSALRGLDIRTHDPEFVNSIFEAMRAPPTRITFGDINPNMSLSPFIPKSLTVLSLSGIYEGRKEQIMPVICSLPLLESLSLEIIHIDKPAGPPPSLPQSLRSLKLVSVLGFFRWFSESETRHQKANLVSLGLVRIYSSLEPAAFISDSLALPYFSTVTCLTLSHPDDIDLGHLSQLRSIHCSFYVPCNSVDLLCRQLQTIQSSHIRNIHLYFKPLIVRKKSDQLYELYEPFLALLALPQFQNVEFVQLCLLGYPISQELRNQLEGWMSDFRARGILSLANNKDESYDSDHMHLWPRMGVQHSFKH
ncbi:hypothetical protein C8J56DRAFT_135758 [Mycena floridula]|nr:hypothetical protein C8J56DRAFT_135758 [Mycena floridula]